jgi:hypothetical protein
VSIELRDFGWVYCETVITPLPYRVGCLSAVAPILIYEWLLKLISIRTGRHTHCSLPIESSSRCTPHETLYVKGGGRRRRITAPTEQNYWQLESLCRYQWSFTFHCCDSTEQKNKELRVRFCFFSFLILERYTRFSLSLLLCYYTLKCLSTRLFFFFSWSDATRQQIHSQKRKGRVQTAPYAVWLWLSFLVRPLGTNAVGIQGLRWATVIREPSVSEHTHTHTVRLCVIIIS